MLAPLCAVKLAYSAGIPVVIANGYTRNILNRVLSGEQVWSACWIVRHCTWLLMRLCLCMRAPVRAQVERACACVRVRACGMCMCVCVRRARTGATESSCSSRCRKAPSAASEHALVLTLHLKRSSALRPCLLLSVCRVYRSRLRVCVCTPGRMKCTLFARPTDVQDCSAVPEEFLNRFSLLCSCLAVLNVCVCVCGTVWYTTSARARACVWSPGYGTSCLPAFLPQKSCPRY